MSRQEADNVVAIALIVLGVWAMLFDAISNRRNR